MAFDFWQYTPEAQHQIMILFSNRGTPKGFRYMNGYSSHTFKWVNDKGEAFFVKYHFKTDQGNKTFTGDEAAQMAVKDKDFATRDLREAIDKGDFPTWTWYAQVMPEKDAENYKYDVLDITKVWPHSDYPLKRVGRMTLNRNPENFHAEVEQAAFNPGHLVPGIEPSNCKMLQGRLYSYPDTHRHRLGTNYDQIPINCPYRARVHNYNRDGWMTVNGNQGGAPNYEPNSMNGPKENPKFAEHSYKLEGTVGRHKMAHPNCHYEQPRTLYNKVLSEEDRYWLVKNLAGPLSKCRRDIQEGMLVHFYRVDPDYARRVSEAIGVPLNKAKL